MRKLVIGFGLAGVVLTGLVTAPAAAAAAAPGDGATRVAVSIPARRIPVDNRFIPPRVGTGDADFNGNGPDILARANLVGVGGNRLAVRIFMDAVETRSDFTRASGTSADFLIYVAPPGQCVRSVNRGTFEEIRYRDTDHAVDDLVGQVTDSFVRTWSFVGDTAGSEAGTRTGAALSTFTFTADVQPC